jgi:DNA-binding XRE family transcriptional regulator
MGTQETQLSRKETDVGEAALTMAIGIVVERVSRLPTQDQQELYELVKGLGGTRDPEEIEAIRVAMLEILDQEQGGASNADPTLCKHRPEKLQKWVSYVAHKVEQLRKAAGLTQADLAVKCGLPQSHISRIESAKLSPSRATLDKIAKGLKIHINQIDPSAE